VVTRAGRRPGATVFGLVCLYLVAWSVAIVIERLTNEPAVLRPLNAVEDAAAFLLPAGTLHIALTLATEGRRSRLQQGVLVATYLLCGAMAAGAVFFPDQQFSVTPPHFELPGIPGEVFGWAWIAVRIAIFLAAVLWISAALASAGDDRARRRQLIAALATVGVGALGGVLRFLPGPADTDPWIGVSLVTLAMVLAAYAVFSQGVFLAPEVAVRAFRYSVITGVVITLYVAALIGVERFADRTLGINLPIVTGLALVITIALFDPITDRLRRVLGGAQGDAASDRLLRALGQDILTAQRPDRAIEPALARLARIFALRGAAISDPTGQLVAEHGQPPGDDPLTLRIPLRADDEYRGLVTFGPKRSQLPFTQREVELLSLAAAYLAASLRLAEQHEAQAEALTALQVEGAAVATRQTALSDALVQAHGPLPEGLHVFSLGPLRAERNGTPVRQWGGAKAGTRQAEAVFAFLFDRGERGAAKDEIIELIWPDVDLERADLAFHRTLGGLRSTLEPGRPGHDRGAAIAFHNDRYRLDPAVVHWSDVGAFEEGVATGSAASDPIVAVQHLERARSLYRGDYLDDCPFYGDSSYVEERRELLRGRMVDLLMILSERYLQRSDRAAAAACLRQANLVAGEELPTVAASLTRLSSSA
jgi:DNA-binding SARP family transcriptional activator